MPTSDDERLSRIEAKLDFLISNLAIGATYKSGESTESEDDSEDAGLSSLTTPKQHAVLQMLLRSATTQEIADRFDVTADTAKTYIRTIAGNLGVKTRAQIAMMTFDEFKVISAKNYRAMTGGVPKDWDANYSEPDECAALFEKRHKGKSDGAEANA